MAVQTAQQQKTFRPTILQHNEVSFKAELVGNQRFADSLSTYAPAPAYLSARGSMTADINRMQFPVFQQKQCNMFASTCPLFDPEMKDSLTMATESASLLNSSQDTFNQSLNDSLGENSKTVFDLTGHLDTDLNEFNDFLKSQES